MIACSIRKQTLAVAHRALEDFNPLPCSVRNLCAFVDFLMDNCQRAQALGRRMVGFAFAERYGCWCLPFKTAWE